MKKKFVVALLILCGCLSLTGCHIISDLASANFVLNKGPMITKIYREKVFHSINIDSINGDIHFKNANHYRVIYKGNKNLMPTVKMYGTTLNIKNKRVARINSIQDITVEMPKRYLNFVDANASNGDIYGSTIMMRTGTITSDNGDVDIKNLFLKKKVKLDSANGDINVDYCNAKGYNLSADNGDVTFNDKNMDDSYNKNSSSQQLLSVYSDNGDVSVN